MTTHALLACPECDLLHKVHPEPPLQAEFCVRCGSVVRPGGGRSNDTALALYVAAFVLFLLANAGPIMAFRLHGATQEATLASCARMLADQGWPWLAAILITTIMVAPAVHLGGMIWVLATLRQGRATRRTAWLFRLVGQFRAWEMGEVFVLGILISWIKLTKDATVMPGPSLVALVAFVATGAAAVSRLNVTRIWQAFGESPVPDLPRRANLTAREAGLVACHTCARIGRLKEGACPRCGATLHSRKPASRERAWALLTTATLLYIPANALPVMRFINLGRTQSDTILSGILHFIRGGSWGLALVIFTASVMVPLVKILVLAFLLVSEQRRLSWKPAQRAFLYRLTEAIGRWSMVDIFVISLMVAMVEMGNIASVGVGPGAFAFGLMVVTTMLAVHFFDPRLVWDALDQSPAPSPMESSHG